MELQDLQNWRPVSEIPALTDGRVSRTSAKRLFRNREVNGLAAAGGACMIGRTALVHVPTFLSFVFGTREAA